MHLLCLYWVMEKVAAIFDVIGQSATQCSSIYVCAHIFSSHWLFVLLLYAFTTPAAAVFFSSSSSPLSFSLISRGTDNNNEAERTKNWTVHDSTVVARVHCSNVSKKSDGKKKNEREKDSRFFFCLLLYSNKLNVNRWLTIFLLLSPSYTNKKNETNG